MREIIRFEDMEVEVWRRRYQRRMYLTVREDGRVRVTCNRSVPRASVLGFVASNRAFVAEHKPGPPPARLTGDRLLIFGAWADLRVTWTWDAHARVEHRDDAIELLAPIGATPADRERTLLAWFRERGRAHLLARTVALAERTRLSPSAVSVRGQSTRWGSCTDRGAISLNWKLVAAPPAVIDYVIVHELAHLRVMNHSARFWRLVAEHDPGFEASRRWLRSNQKAIHAQFAMRHDAKVRG